jgi:hypothetical protein
MSRGCVRSLLCAAAVALCACPGALEVAGENDPAPTGPLIVVQSDDPDQLDRLDFGAVQFGYHSLREVRIRNLGDATLAIESVQISGAPAFEIHPNDDYEALVPPLESTWVEVSYTPAEDQDAEALLVIRSNAANDGQVELQLSAQGLAPRVELSPTSYDFGLVQVGCAVDHEVTITNAGRAVADVLDVHFDNVLGGGGLSWSFAPLVDGDPATVDLQLVPGESVQAFIDYAPTAETPDSGELRVITNTPGEADGGAASSTQGIGLGTTSHVDQFVAAGQLGVDVLVVLDASGSMADEQAALPENLGAFADGLVALGLDFHLSLTSMDISGMGQFVGTIPTITSSTPDPSAWLVSNASDATGGGPGYGLHNAWQALEAAVNHVGNNSGFHRDDAELRLLFITDGPEESSSVMGWVVADYVAYFQGLKARPERVVLGNVSGGLAGCVGAGGSATSSADYVLASSSTGGPSVSICSPAWWLDLSPSWLQTGLDDLFELTQLPTPSTISVEVGGVPATTGWAYDEERVAIVFDQDLVPEEGTSVDVSYDLAPTCP